MCTCLRDTCMEELKDQISNFYFQESVKFIDRVRETRHQTVFWRDICQNLIDCGRDLEVSSLKKIQHMAAQTQGLENKGKQHPQMS